MATVAVGIAGLIYGCQSAENPPLPSASIEETKRDPLPLRARFRIAEEDSNTPEAIRFFDAIERDELAKASGVSVETRTVSSGTDETPVRTLVANDRAALGAVLDNLDKHQPELLPQPGSEILVQEETLGDGPGASTRWRGYWADTKHAVEPNELTDVKVVIDGIGLPQVAVELGPQDRDKFKAMTERSVGRMILIAIENRVLSAPVVQEPITGGRAFFSPGGPGKSPAELTKEAEALVLQLVGDK